MAEELSPDRYCITLPNGACVGGLEAGLSACMHDVVETERIEKWYQEWLSQNVEEDSGV